VAARRGSRRLLRPAGCTAVRRRFLPALRQRRASAIAGASRTVGSASGWLTAIALTAPLACDLDVTTPSRLPAEQLDSPSAAQLLVNSGAADLTCALGAWVVVSGLVSGELNDAKTLVCLLWLQKWRDGRWALNWQRTDAP
jgi:hypothetical protein